MLARFKLFLALLLTCLGLGAVAGASPAAASTHYQRSVVGYYYAMDKCNNYQGCANLAYGYGGTIYYRSYSYFMYTYTTRYCGRKYYEVTIADNYTHYVISSFGGNC